MRIFDATPRANVDVSRRGHVVCPYVSRTLLRHQSTMRRLDYAACCPLQYAITYTPRHPPSSRYHSRIYDYDFHFACYAPYASALRHDDDDMSYARRARVMLRQEVDAIITIRAMRAGACWHGRQSRDSARRARRGDMRSDARWHATLLQRYMMRQTALIGMRCSRPYRE